MNNVYHDRDRARTSSSVVLMLACGAQLMVVLDGLIVSVALPDMRSGLTLSATGQQWIVDGYLITFGGLLLLAGRAADLIGQRAIFLIGTAVFTLASLAGGLAPNGAALIAARLVQGAGAAALAPGSLSLLTTTYADEQRGRAISIWSATSGSAGALGLVLGGVITSGLGWRWVLLVNVPVGVALWITASVVLPRPRTSRRTHIDLAGAATITLAVAALTYAFSRAQQDGWTSTGTLLSIAAGATALRLFIAVERRVTEPLVPMSIFRCGNVVTANLVVALLGAVMTATMVLLSLYQQHILGLSPLRTGLALLPMSVVLTGGALAAKALMTRYGARPLLVIGAILMAAGTLLLADLPAHSQYATHILVPTLVWAAGAGLLTMPAVTLATSNIDAGRAGLASALVNSARQVGGAIGLAALTGIAAAATSGTGHATSAQTLHGYRTALLAAAVLAALIAPCAMAAPTKVGVRP